MCLVVEIFFIDAIRSSLKKHLPHNFTHLYPEELYQCQPFLGSETDLDCTRLYLKVLKMIVIRLCFISTRTRLHRPGTGVIWVNLCSKNLFSVCRYICSLGTHTRVLVVSVSSPVNFIQKNVFIVITKSFCHPGRILP